MMKNKKVYLCSFEDTGLGISLDSKKRICSMGEGGGGHNTSLFSVYFLKCCISLLNLISFQSIYRCFLETRHHG